MRDGLTWYVVVQVAGLAVWPLVARALAPLEDRGWAASKVAGLLLIAWLVWLVCMLTPLPFTRLTLALALVGVGIAAWLYEWRTGGWQVLVDWLRQRRRLVLAWESVFLAAFVLFALLRSHDPALSSAAVQMSMPVSRQESPCACASSNNGNPAPQPRSRICRSGRSCKCSNSSAPNLDDQNDSSSNTEAISGLSML